MQLQLAVIPSMLVSTAITVFIIIALAVSRSDDVKGACGMDLWNWTVANLVLWLSLVLLLAVLSAPAVALCGPLVAMATAGVVYLVAMVTMTSLGATYLAKAAEAGGCMDALSDNFMKAPMLIIMGWISVGMQCLTLLVLVCSGVVAACWGVVLHA